MKTIGIIGGGQLGLMIAEQARELGVRTVCLDPAADAPAFNVCDDHIVAAYDDAGGPCTVVSTDETGTLIIPKGGTAVGLLSPDGRWVERSELRTVRADGSPAELLASSFTGVVALERKVSDEEFLDHELVYKEGKDGVMKEI